MRYVAAKAENSLVPYVAAKAENDLVPYYYYHYYYHYHYYYYCYYYYYYYLRKRMPKSRIQDGAPVGQDRAKKKPREAKRAKMRPK